MTTKQKCGQSKSGIPINAQILTAPSKKQYYLSGIDAQHNQAIIKYIDGGFVRIDLGEYNRNK